MLSESAVGHQIVKMADGFDPGIAVIHIGFVANETVFSCLDNAG